MDLDFILLTSSKKSGNYCIAGIEIQTGNWVRIISEDTTIQHAITPEQMIYEDKSMPQILDKIRVKCKKNSPNYYQPENYVLDSSYCCWHKLGEACIEDVLDKHPLQDKQFIFYNSNKNIDSSYLKSLASNEKYSLYLVAPQNIWVHVKHWPERVQITMSFDYNGNRYSYLSITDAEFGQMYAQKLDGNYIYREDCLLVVSLGDIYPDNGKHYKLIAKVISI